MNRLNELKAVDLGDPKSGKGGCRIDLLLPKSLNDYVEAQVGNFLIDLKREVLLELLLNGAIAQAEADSMKMNEEEFNYDLER